MGPSEPAPVDYKYRADDLKLTVKSSEKVHNYWTKLVRYVAVYLCFFAYRLHAKASRSKSNLFKYVCLTLFKKNTRQTAEITNTSPL